MLTTGQPKALLPAVALALGCSATDHPDPPVPRAQPETVAAPARATAPAQVAPPVAAEPELAAVTQAAQLAARYLTGACAENGRFTYRINLNPAVTPRPSYNILRHAGAMYALASYQAVFPDDRVAATLERASRYLQQVHIAPLPRRPELLAAWSEPAAEGRREAKLGGTGLALVALAGLEQAAPGSVELADLRRLAALVGFMQQADGSFHSKYLPGQDGGRFDSWVSLYYPGEATLGLLQLYELDPDERWLTSAGRALAYLAQHRAGEVAVPADHWALLATAAWLARERRAGAGRPTRAEVVAHAVQICESMLRHSPSTFDQPGPLRGSFTADGRTTPTATRLEGLLAALTFLPPSHSELRARIARASHQAIAFLLQAQVKTGPHAGAVPRAVLQLKGRGKGQRARRHNRRATEVRIDYVQHALSAWLGYLAWRSQAAGASAVQ